ncbi:Oidioi.mRNA.OKI2018_I69.chr1.g197.t1.cds [Oikopleura dioica]|uniref:Oidioi.mRNA.OKI2018_I69.chr1.g197.t1.cds n=1 Tax=Oikopleura dioica TaxID=34765 RepID=A0ABN7SJ33_OIKDI|nr:Oidioi.mRNA.OKI2018_I69.chr1.g197.t1.cds [Oikopleura dioica]
MIKPEKRISPSYRKVDLSAEQESAVQFLLKQNEIRSAPRIPQTTTIVLDGRNSSVVLNSSPLSRPMSVRSSKGAQSPYGFSYGQFTKTQAENVIVNQPLTRKNCRKIESRCVCCWNCCYCFCCWKKETTVKFCTFC